LSAPTFENAHASGLAWGEIDRHWWTKPNPMAAATTVFPESQEIKNE
jgi:hypothetical protein